MKKTLSYLLLSLTLVACSRTQLLNMQNHEFGVQPRHIVWFQVPGLSEEHLAMLRFALVNNEKKTALEGMECFGKLWTYNFYSLRPAPAQGLLSQTVGKDDIKGSCQDYKHKPLWKTFETLNYRNYILESHASKENSLLQALACPSEGAEFLENLSFFSMSKSLKKEDKLFHYQDKAQPGVEETGIYYDRSCQEGSCFSTLTENTRQLYQRIVGEKKNYLFMIRTFILDNQLKAGKISEVRDGLSELEKLVAFFKAEAQKDPQMLVVVSSTAPKSIEYPEQGLPWMEFENQGKNVLYKKSGLLAPVFSFGAGAENFCGMYGEAEILSRFLWFKTNKDHQNIGFWF